MTRLKPTRVLVWGTFDLLHEGHLAFLSEAKKLGDELCGIVVPDSVVDENKKRNPIQTADVRLSNLESLPIVNQAFVDCLSRGLKCLDCIRPDVVCIGYDQDAKWAEELRRALEARGMRPRFVRLGKYAGGLHSSDLVKEPVPAFAQPAFNSNRASFGSGR